MIKLRSFTGPPLPISPLPSILHLYLGIGEYCRRALFPKQQLVLSLVPAIPRGLTVEVENSDGALVCGLKLVPSLRNSGLNMLA